MSKDRLPRNVRVAALTSFLTDVSSEMVLNLLPLFLANVFGASTAFIGLMEGVAETTSSLLKGVSGWLSDKIGTRKWLAVAGYGFSAFSKPLLYIVTSPVGALFVRFLDRIGKGVRTAPRDALIADSVNEQQRGRAFGLHRASDTAGAFLGLLVTLAVVLALQADAVTLTMETFHVLVLLSIVPAILAVGVLAWGAQDVPLPAKPKSAAPRLRWQDMGRDFQRFVGIMALFTLGNSSDAFLLLRAQERGLSVAGVVAMLLTFNFIYALLATPLGTLSDRIGRRRVLMGGWGVYALIYLAFALVQTGWQVWIVYAFYGVYYAAVEGTAKAYIADLILPEQRGTAYGIYNMVIGLMALPASLFAGFLWQSVSPAAPFALGATLALGAAVLLWWLPSAKLGAMQIS